MKNLTIANVSYPNVPAIQVPITGGGTATFYDVEGSQNITVNGTYDVTTLSEVVVDVSGGGGIIVTEETDAGGGIIKHITGTVVSGNMNITENGTYNVVEKAQVTVNVPTGSSKNVQGYMGMDYTTATSYTATDVTLTCSKTGTYNVSWMGFRNTTSGTSGSQLYVNGTARGSAYTTFTRSYGQEVTISSVSLSEGDVLVVRARARSSSYYMYVGNLIIEEQ